MIARTCQSRRAQAVAVVAALATFALACSGPARRARPAPPDRSGSRPAPPRARLDVDYEARKLRPGRLSKSMRARCERYEPMVRDLALEHGVDPALVLAIVRVESGFRPDARSRVGARGMMQIMPRTGRGMKCRDLWDPEDNVRCGIRVLKRYTDRFDGHIIYGLAAYNGGPGYVKDEYAARRLPRNFRYVEKVLKMQSFFRRHGCGG